MTPEDIEKIIWIFIALVTVGLLLAGLCNQCVIYYDAADVGVTFLGVCLPSFGAALLSPEVKPFDLESLNYVVRYGGGGVLVLIGLWCFVLTFIYSIRHNRSVLLALHHFCSDFYLRLSINKSRLDPPDAGSLRLYGGGI